LSQPANGVPEVSVPLQNLIVDSSLYPTGWKPRDNSTSSSPVEEEEENFHTTYVFRNRENQISYHEVLRYYTEKEAQRAAAGRVKQTQSYFQGRGVLSSLSTATEEGVWASCISLENNTEKVCIAIAHYGVYVSEFSAYLSDDAMSEEKFMQIVDAISKKINMSLYGKNRS
jgi:hypothetical protein